MFGQLSGRYTEQEGFAQRLAFLEAQIKAGILEYEQAQAHLEDCLGLAGACHSQV